MSGLHIQYRPNNFSEVMGNTSTVKAIQSILNRLEDKRPHVFLLSGPKGTGKTSIARIIAKHLNCSKTDLVLINSANNRGIETAREITNNMRYKPLDGKIKVYLLEEVHKFTKDFMDAMLIPFEDTPSHVYFVLCTTNPEKLLKTILSRCTQFTTTTLKQNRIIRLLKQVAKKENIELSEEIYKEIAVESEGTPRNALVMLDKIRDLEDETDMLEVIRESKVDEKQVLDLCRALLKRDNWKNIAKIIKGIDVEPEKVRYAILGYMTSVLLNGNNSEKAAVIIECFEDNFYNSGKAGLVKACFESVS